MSENKTRPAPAWRRKRSYTEGKMFCAGFCFAFFNFLGKIFRKWLTIRQSAGIITPVVRHGTDIWGISSAGRALAWHARGHRFDPGILHQKSTVLRREYGAFLFAEAGFWGAALLRLHRFQAFGGSYITSNFWLYTIFKKECLPPGFSAGCCIIPFNRRSKRRWSPTIREATAFVDYRISQP